MFKLSHNRIVSSSPITDRTFANLTRLFAANSEAVHATRQFRLVLFPILDPIRRRDAVGAFAVTNQPLVAMRLAATGAGQGRLDDQHLIGHHLFTPKDRPATFRQLRLSDELEILEIVVVVFLIENVDGRAETLVRPAKDAFKVILDEVAVHAQPLQRQKRHPIQLLD